MWRRSWQASSCRPRRRSSKSRERGEEYPSSSADSLRRASVSPPPRRYSLRGAGNAFRTVKLQSTTLTATLLAIWGIGVAKMGDCTVSTDHQAETAFAVETIWGDGQTFTESATDVRADVLRVRDNARIFFKNGIDYRIQCNKLILGKDVFFDCTGANGVDAQQPGSKPTVQCTGTAAQHQFIVHPAFLRFAMDPSAGHFGYNASPGEGGHPGANVVISFHEYAGEIFNPKVQVDLRGGQGGKGAPGGPGPVIRCTPAPGEDQNNPCHGALVAGPGASSGPGSPGKNGSFKLQPP